MTHTMIIKSVAGKPWLKSLALPVTVKAKYAYDGCYDVFGEEFRKLGIKDRMPNSNNGKGLLNSFYDASQYELLNNH